MSLPVHDSSRTPARHDQRDVRRRMLGPDRPPIIVLGTGITALGTLRALGRGGLAPLVADTLDPLLRSSRWYRPVSADRPLIEGQELASWLAALKIDRAVLMPCSDHSVIEVAALPPRLRERFPASVPGARTLDRFVDKGLFAELLRTAGVPRPFSKPISVSSDLDDVPDSVLSSAILNPRDSQAFIAHFHTKALYVASREDAVAQLARVRAAGFPVILQEYIPGPPSEHYFVDGFIDRHQTIRAVLVRQRLRMHPIDFGNSTAMVSIEPTVAAPAVAFISSLLTVANYRGMFSAEFTRDPRDGIFKILEVNARAWWYVDFAARCGIDVCRMAYEDALDRPVRSVEHYAVGRRLVYPYYDYEACKALRAGGELSAWGWIRSWLGAMQPVFQLEDPVPGTLAMMRTLGGSIRRRLAHLLSAVGLSRGPAANPLGPFVP
jgi:predicted ATP-grasp superfamily ATP-dependent carboligase